MELGRSRLRRNGLNTLKDALHPKHGLAWTDGKSVYLTAVKHLEKGTESDKHIKLGEFQDHVESLYWSNDLGSLSFLSVVHQKTVSLWWVEGSLPNLTFKQTRKISAAALPQGCLWNPYSDVLCILTKQQCSFYYQHLMSRSSYALPPINSGKITCGCWSRDGQRLFVAMGSIVMIYSWADFEKSVDDFSVTAWKIPDVDGHICSMVSLSNIWVMCTVELPLEALCKQKADLFEVPSITCTTAEQEIDVQNNNNEMPDVISPRKENSPSMTDKLFNLQRTEEGKIQDCSQLIVFSIESSVEHPSIVCSTNIQGILVPDILHFHRHSFHAVLGSNNQNKVHIYHIGELFKEITKVDEVETNSGEMVKGIACYSTKNSPYIILMTAATAPSDPAFISPTVYKDCDLHLRVVPFPDRQNMSRTGSGERKLSLPKSDTSKSKHEKKSKHKDRSGRKTDAQGIDKFLGLFGKSPKGPKIIDMSKNKEDDEDLEIETVRFDDVSAKFADHVKFSYENLTEEEFNMAVRKGSVSSSDNEDDQNGKPGNQTLDDSIISADMSHGPLSRLSRESRKSGGSLPLLPLVTPTEEFTEHQLLRSTPSGMSSPRTRIRLGINSLKSSSRSQSVPSMLDGEIEIPAPDIISTGDHKGAERSPDSVFFPNSPVHPDHLDGSLLSHDVPSTPGIHENPHHSREWDELEKQVQQQGTLLAELHDKIDTVLKCSGDTSCVPLSGYQELDEPETITLNYMYHDEDESLEKTFLLDRRRIKLDVVLHAFHLESLEISIGETAVIVGANVDGYIPIRFTPGSTVQISGLKKKKKKSKG